MKIIYLTFAIIGFSLLSSCYNSSYCSSLKKAKPAPQDGSPNIGLIPTLEKKQF